MYDDRIGIETDKVSNYIDRLTYFIKKENEIHSSIKELEEITKKSYKSSNSQNLEKFNENILEAEYCKKENLNSYKNYINKYIVKYEKIAQDSIELLDNLNYK